MSAPTFSLPACPLCSNAIIQDRPFWHRASNATAKAGAPAYILIGCRHAVPAESEAVIRYTPAEWAEVEAKWAREAEAMFAVKTADWSPLQVDAFRRALGSSFTLPGATDPLPLSTETKTT